MSTSAPAAASTAKKPGVPPEEQFWERYSPHNEAPLSGVSSTVLHILIIGLIIGVVWVQSFLKLDEEHRSLPVEPIRFSQAGGGGSRTGNDKGDGVGQDSGEPQLQDENLAENDVNRSNKPVLPEHQPIDPSKSPKVKQEFGEKSAQRPTAPIRDLMDLSDAARNKLRKGGSSRGQGGSGTDGGRDSGKDVGEGSGTGKDKAGQMTKREKRNNRWVIQFNTRDGQDYLNKLIGLGAIIAIPVDADKGIYKIIRDLRNPKPQEVNIDTIDGIRWLDSKPESVADLLRSLGQPPAPFFAAFFPKELEDQMLRLELAYTERRYRTRDEERIHETHFDPIKEGDKYTVKVREVYMTR